MIPGKVKAGVLSAVNKAVADKLFTTFMLWFISKKPAHGYEIISTLRKERHFVHVGPAMVYPVLAGLSKRKLIRVKEEARGRRVRKLYSITPAGRKRLQDMKKLFSRDSLRTRFMREMLS
jgi:DNA-binding PadR family transcriptional regulator